MNVEVVLSSSERRTRNGSNHDGPSSSLEPGERIIRSRSSRQVDLETVLKKRSSSLSTFQKSDPPGMQATELAASVRERAKELEKKQRSNRASSPRRKFNRASSPRRTTNRASSPRRQTNRASSPRRQSIRSKSKDAEERHHRRGHSQSSEPNHHHRMTHYSAPPPSRRESDEAAKRSRASEEGTAAVAEKLATRKKEKKESSSSKRYHKSSSSRSSSSSSSSEKKKKVLVKRGQSFVIEMKEEEEGGMKASDKEKKENNKVEGNSSEDVSPRKRSGRFLQDNSDFVEAESIFSWSRMMPNKDHMINTSRQSFTTATLSSSTSAEDQPPKSERTDSELMLQSNKTWDEICSRESTATAAKATTPRASARKLVVRTTANTTIVDHHASVPTRGGGDKHVQGSKSAFGSITRDVLEEVMQAKLSRSPPKRQSSLQMIRQLSPTKSNRKMVLQSRPPPEAPEAAQEGEQNCPTGKLAKEEEEIIWTPDFWREQNNTINHTRTSSAASAKSKPIEQVKSERRTEVDQFSLSDFQADTDLEDEFNSLRLGDTAWFLQEDR